MKKTKEIVDNMSYLASNLVCLKNDSYEVKANKCIFYNRICAYNDDICINDNYR